MLVADRLSTACLGAGFGSCSWEDAVALLQAVKSSRKQACGLQAGRQAAAAGHAGLASLQHAWKVPQGILLQQGAGDGAR